MFYHSSQHKVHINLDACFNIRFSFFIFQDQGVKALAEKTKVVVNVRDVDDMKPYFVFEQYKKEIEENLPIGSSIAIVSAKDGDEAINNEINYEIVAGA